MGSRKQPRVLELRGARTTLLLAAGLTGALGCTVIVGWHLHVPELVQVHRAFVAMQYNTALGFVLCAAALLAASKRRGRATQSLGAALMLLGGLTLLQYVARVDLGIDELLMQHRITVQASHPGRMAPNTAVCFVLSGAAISWSALAPRRWTHWLGVMGVIVASLGVVALVGYFADLTTRWGQLTRMAVHTATGFCAVGTALVALARLHVGVARWYRWSALPVMSSIGVLTFTACLTYAALAAQEQAERARTLQSAHAAAAETEHMLAANVNALKRMSDRWTARGGTPSRELRSDAQTYIEDIRGLTSLAGYDKSLRRVWVVGDEAAARSSHDAAVERAIAAMPDLKRPAITPAQPRGSGFLVLVPLRSHDRYDGVIAASFDVDQLVADVVNQAHYTDYATALHRGDADAGAGTEERRGQIVELTLGPNRWRLRMWTHAGATQRFASMLPSVIVVSGVLLALALLALFVFVQRNLSQAEELDVTTLALEDFASTAVHNLRQPVRAIDGLAHELATEAELDADQHRLVERIGAATGVLASMLESLIDYIKIGSRRLAPRSVDLSALAHTVAQECIASTAGADAGVVLSVPPTMMARADRPLLEALLRALVHNAVTHGMDSSGKLRIEIGMRPGDVTAFYVRDDGVGFDMDHAANLFEPFHTLAASEQRAGLGAGLALAKRIVERHGGEIWAESARGDGAAFFFTLEPRAGSASAPIRATGGPGI